MRLFAGAALLAGCPGGDGPAPCEPADNPTLEIGAGEGSFMPLSAGDEIELVHGPQGGYHLTLGLEATGIDGSSLVAGELRGTVEGVELATSFPWLDLQCNKADAALQTWGQLLIYDANPDELHRRQTTITAELTDTVGTVVTTELELLIVDPALDG